MRIKEKKDYKKAILWYKKSAQVDNKEANFYLARLYTFQLHKYKKAIKRFQMVYNSKNKNFAAQAASWIGYIYKSEYKDFNQSIKWYKKSYSLNDIEAALSIAYIYFYNKEIQDFKKAIKWFKIGYEKGPKGGLNTQRAAYQIGFIYETKYKNYKKASIWYKKAYKSGMEKALKKYNYFKINNFLKSINLINITIQRAKSNIFY